MVTTPSYSLVERDRRWAMAREVMRELQLDALLVYGEHECAPLAPFAPDVYFSNDRPGSIVVFVRDEKPVQLVWSPMSIGDHIEARKRGDQVWFEPARIRVGKDTPHVAALLQEYALTRGRVGVLGLEPYPPFHILPVLPHALYAPLTEQFPDATFVPAWLPLLRKMICNSDEELAVVRHAAGIGDEMARAMREATRPGVSEAAIFATGMHEAFVRGAQAPHMLLSSGPGFVSWGPLAWSYRPQAPRTVERGDVVMAEVFVSFGMKETQHQVSIAVGDIHPDVQRAADVAGHAYEAGLALLRPGRTFGDVAQAMLDIVEGVGGWNVHPMVHSINPYGPVCGFGAGLAKLPQAGDYDGLGAVPNIGFELPLAPGMTFALEPNCVINGRVANLGGTVIVDESGPIELNPLTNRLLPAEG